MLHNITKEKIQNTNANKTANKIGEKSRKVD